ncbi:MAG: hypothetical protein IPK85_04180 [Gemmatimonadetes bacterium]|nr:hypothetical protein [Gemmatimonadota bacterium]
MSPTFTPLEPGAVDQIIQATRAATPQSVTNMRQTPRLTISELNDLNSDAIVARLRNTHDDNRSTVTKVLDMIDLPRNVVGRLVWGAVAPGALAEARQRGEIGAAGLPRVTGADALRALGVKNQVIRGVVGFGLDVAMDPLTYVGPAGWGLKVSGATGRTINVGARGAKALRRGIAQAAEGATVHNDEVRRLVEAAGFTADKIAELRTTLKDPRKVAGEIRAGVLGVQPSQGVLGRAGAATGKVLGFDPTFKGEASILGKYLDDGRWISIDPTLDAVQRSQAEAARAFYKRYGKGASGSLTEVGIRLGRGGSQVLHVPFTEIGLSVPAFTREEGPQKPSSRSPPPSPSL